MCLKLRHLIDEKYLALLRKSFALSDVSGTCLCADLSYHTSNPQVKTGTGDRNHNEWRCQQVPIYLKLQNIHLTETRIDMKSH